MAPANVSWHGFRVCPLFSLHAEKEWKKNSEICVELGSFYASPVFSQPGLISLHSNLPAAPKWDRNSAGLLNAGEDPLIPFFPEAVCEAGALSNSSIDKIHN